MNIQLPSKKGQPNTNPVLDFEQLVIIGANGSGKTRFGSNIEQRYYEHTHRISAQKSLSMPDFVSTKSKEVAEGEFLYGHWDKSNPNYYKTQGWIQARWGNDMNTFLLNDYEKLMVLLHTEEYELSLNFKENGGSKPNTKLDRIQKIWETILPHRKLIKKAGVIEAYPTEQKNSIYNASQMSDGERVIFYLIGEAICAPEKSIIIIDEPEMHIHRSLVKKLFDQIEVERLDCFFIYLTHDIDFAITRQNAVKIWTKSYNSGDIWDYEFLDKKAPIPEQLYLEVLGSRKPIIFLEGDNSSIDYQLYEQVYSDYTIKPLGSCEKVIHSVKSFNEQTEFHHLQSFGIIDRDRRSDVDLSNLNSKNIWVLDVAEVENLLLEESIVKAIANHLGRNPEETFNEIKRNLIEFFQESVESQILLHFKEVLRKKLLGITNFESKNILSVISEIDNTFLIVDKQKIYDDIKIEFNQVIDNSNFDKVLRFFNLKNALIPRSKVCELTGIKNSASYFKLVITLLKRNDSVSDDIKRAIDKKVLKNIK
ncbi:DUF4435 domain-containing protein [Persicitalea sp.]|uniref:DUF4435 domain-containing protein n=1 Tax=Persicitalea sp. TaxID=3100273 RepID=UPI0035931608